MCPMVYSGFLNRGLVQLSVQFWSEEQKKVFLTCSCEFARIILPFPCNSKVKYKKGSCLIGMFNIWDINVFSKHFVSILLASNSQRGRCMAQCPPKNAPECVVCLLAIKRTIHFPLNLNRVIFSIISAIPVCEWNKSVRVKRSLL